jgi:hypothetical protein
MPVTNKMATGISSARDDKNHDAILRLRWMNDNIKKHEAVRGRHCKCYGVIEKTLRFVFALSPAKRFNTVGKRDRFF